jgi:hypothetical protein
MEDLMLDECEITRDPQGRSDDTWDDETGTYTKPALDREEVYTGKCSYGTTRAQSRDALGGVQSIITGYGCSIPKGSNKVRPRDQLVITAVDPVNGDPTVVGKVFVIDEIIHSTYSVSQRFLMHLITERPVRA